MDERSQMNEKCNKCKEMLSIKYEHKPLIFEAFSSFPQFVDKPNSPIFAFRF
jgi:hypothetical protein